jgi:hypothetical protein
VTKDKLPKYGLWKVQGTKDGVWEEDTGFKVEAGSIVERTVSGAAACTGGKCYWVGSVPLL